MESIKEFPRGIPAGMGGALCVDPEAGTDQAISDSTATANDSVRPGPGLVCAFGRKATSYKLQAASNKLQATSFKLQASGEAASNKRSMWFQSSSAKHGVSR